MKNKKLYSVWKIRKCAKYSSDSIIDRTKINSTRFLFAPILSRLVLFPDIHFYGMGCLNETGIKKK